MKLSEKILAFTVASIFVLSGFGKIPANALQVSDDIKSKQPNVTNTTPKNNINNTTTSGKKNNSKDNHKKRVNNNGTSKKKIVKVNNNAKKDMQPSKQPVQKLESPEIIPSVLLRDDKGVCLIDWDFDNLTVRKVFNLRYNHYIDKKLQVGRGYYSYIEELRHLISGGIEVPRSIGGLSFIVPSGWKAYCRPTECFRGMNEQGEAEGTYMGYQDKKCIVFDSNSIVDVVKHAVEAPNWTHAEMKLYKTSFIPKEGSEIYLLLLTKEILFDFDFNLLTAKRVYKNIDGENVEEMKLQRFDDGGIGLKINYANELMFTVPSGWEARFTLIEEKEGYRRGEPLVRGLNDPGVVKSQGDNQYMAFRSGTVVEIHPYGSRYHSTPESQLRFYRVK